MKEQSVELSYGYTLILYKVSSKILDDDCRQIVAFETHIATDIADKIAIACGDAYNRGYKVGEKEARKKLREAFGFNEGLDLIKKEIKDLQSDAEVIKRKERASRGIII